MKLRLLQWLAIVLVLETGLLHLVTAQAEYEEAAYMGYLFAANFLGTLVAAAGIYHRRRRGWDLGALICALSMAGYIWSRTLGMPQMPVEDWLGPYGIAAMTVEGLFLFVCFLRPWRIAVGEPPAAAGFVYRYVLPAAGLLFLCTASLLVYEWDRTMPRAYGHHVGSLDEVCSTPVTTAAELQERYGLRVSLVAVSMMDSIVDVRLSVVDPQKAALLLKDQAALLVDQKELILAPHQHHHGSIKRDKVHFLFFPTRDGTVRPGSTVNLVFGSVRLETVVVR